MGNESREFLATWSHPLQEQAAYVEYHLRAAYEKGVEDSAGVGYMAVKDPNDAAVVRDAIRALKEPKP